MMNEQNKDQNKHVKWHQLTGEDALRQLRSNASCGLTCKEARSRLRKGGANTLFDPPHRTDRLFKMLLTDPAILLFVAVCVLSICFSEFSVGIPALVVFAIWLAVMLRMVFRMRRYRERSRAERIPVAEVLRDGTLSRVSARNIVRGDILFLRAGDIVPADCRLLSGEELRTRLFLSENGKEKPTRTDQVKRAETVYPYGTDVQAPYCENMLYGGAEILSGCARAVVCETGTHSFFGAMGEGLGIDPFADDPKLLSGIYPYLRLFGFAMLILMLPLSITALLASPEEMSAMRVFLPVCAFVATASATGPYIYFYVLLHRGMRHPGGQKRESTCFRSTRAVDRMPHLTDLILTDRSAVSDGKMHFACAHNGKQLFLSGAEEDPGLQPLCEAMVLLYRAEEQLPQGTDDGLRGTELIEELIAASGYDCGALAVRLLRTEWEASEGKDRLLRVETREETFRLRFSPGLSALAACSGCETGLGRAEPMEPEMREHLRLFAIEALENCDSMLTITKERNGRTLSVGTVVWRPLLLPDIPATVQALVRGGVRVSWFLPTETREDMLFAECCVAGQAVQSASDGAPLTVTPEHVRCFAGYSNRQIAAYLRKLRKSHRTAAVLSGRAEDSALHTCASLSIACAGEQNISDTSGCAQTVRRHADLILPPVCGSAENCGLNAFLRAREASSESVARVRSLLGGLFLLQIFRVVFFSLCVFTGAGPMPAYAFLYASFFPDLFVLIWNMSAKPKPGEGAPGGILGHRAMKNFFRNRGLWLTTAVPAAAFVFLMLIFRLSGLLDATSGFTLMFGSMTVMQLILLFFARGLGRTQLPPAQLTVTCVCILLIPQVVVALLSAFIPAVGAVTEFGGWNAVSGGLFFLSPFLCLGSVLLFSRFTE